MYCRLHCAECAGGVWREPAVPGGGCTVQGRTGFSDTLPLISVNFFCMQYIVEFV
jgi:hypothetical protein